MYRQLLVLSAAVLLTLGSGSTTEASYIRNKQPNAYIVEIQRSSSIDSLSSIPGAKIRYTYDSDILHGASVEFSDPAIAKRALSQPDIINAWQVGHHARPSSTSTSYHSNNSSHKLQPLTPDEIPTLTLAYSNVSRQLKTDGSGVRVGIIDSGVDYRHPALGGCFGTGCRIAYGYDLVGDDYNGSPDSIKEDDDPLDNCPAGAVGATGHGTFVTGLVGAIDKTYNWTGAAPGATLGMWRVFGCKSQSATTDIFIKAMEMAYEAGMDVINLSLGENGGWEEDVLAVFADRLVDHGVHVVVATGNIGTSGIFLVASPATARNVISVGSLTNTHLPAYVLNVTRVDSKYKTDHHLTIPYRTIDNSAVVQQNATSLVFSEQNDKCIDKNLDVDGRLVLVPQEGCDLNEQLSAYSKAAAIVAYSGSNSSTASPSTYNSSVIKVPVAFISGADAKEIFAFVRRDNKKTKKEEKDDDDDADLSAQLTSLLVAVPAPASDAGRFAGFTSLGPTNELRMKPEICALGGDLFGTLPLNLGAYGFLSGTSTSAPLVSGYVALLVDFLKGQKPDVQTVKESLMNFASPLKSPVSSYSTLGDAPVRQGAGAINVPRTVQGLAQFHVSPSALSFNDTANFNNGTQTLTIFNHAKETLEFRMVHGPALTTAGYDLKNSSDYTPQEPIGLGVQDPTVATVTFSSDKLSVPAGGSAKVQVHLTVSTRVFAPNSHAIYGGYIGVALEDASIAASVPYIGMIGNMTDLPILDRSNTGMYPFPSIGNPDGSILDSNETGHYSPGQWPTLLLRLLTGTPLVDVQVLDEDKKVLGSMPYNVMNAYTTHEWLPRNTKTATSSSTMFEAWVWNGQYISKQNDSEVHTVPTGVYYLRIRALRVFGDRDNDHDWDTWMSPRLKMDFSRSSSSSSSLPIASSIKPPHKPTEPAIPISIEI